MGTGESNACKQGLNGKPPDSAPNCFKCRWYYVTWDAQFPNGCKIFQFKTHAGALPSAEVHAATGTHCPQFEKNPRIKE
jgi:hypothetical protein